MSAVRNMMYNNYHDNSSNSSFSDRHRNDSSRTTVIEGFIGDFISTANDTGSDNSPNKPQSTSHNFSIINNFIKDDHIHNNNNNNCSGSTGNSSSNGYGCLNDIEYLQPTNRIFPNKNISTATNTSRPYAHSSADNKTALFVIPNAIQYVGFIVVAICTIATFYLLFMAFDKIVNRRQSRSTAALSPYVSQRSYAATKPANLMCSKDDSHAVMPNEPQRRVTPDGNAIITMTLTNNNVMIIETEQQIPAFVTMNCTNPTTMQTYDDDIIMQPHDNNNCDYYNCGEDSSCNDRIGAADQMIITTDDEDKCDDNTSSYSDGDRGSCNLELLQLVVRASGASDQCMDELLVGHHRRNNSNHNNYYNTNNNHNYFNNINTNSNSSNSSGVGCRADSFTTPDPVPASIISTNIIIDDHDSGQNTVDGCDCDQVTSLSSNCSQFDQSQINNGNNDDVEDDEDDVSNKIEYEEVLSTPQ